MMKRENIPYVSIVLIALIVRLWELGERTMHYDEGVHVTCANNFFPNPLPWCLQGWTHGPFQFEGTAFFFLFGTNEVTARLLPVIIGTAMVALPYFLRRQLGHWGSLVVSALLAFSPFLMFYSRYTRNEIYIAFFMLLLVVCVWRYFEERKARYLYIGAAAMSFSFGAKEVAFITVAVIAIFLLVISAREFGSAIRNRFNLSNLSGAGDFLILIATLSLPLFAPFINLVLPDKGLGRNLGDSDWSYVWLSFLVVVGAVVGLRWNWRRWTISALTFWGIYILMYTIFFTEPEYLAGGVWETIAYWVTQHEVARGGQPEYYYMILVPIYEFFPVIFAGLAAGYYGIKEAVQKRLYSTIALCISALTIILYAALGLQSKTQATVLIAISALSMVLYIHFSKAKLFPRFLLYWAAISLILFSYFGEKMPWLAVHIALPAIVIAGMFIGRILEAFNWRKWDKSHPPSGISWIIAALGSLSIFVGIWARVATSSNLSGIVPALIVIGVLLLVVGIGRLFGWKQMNSMIVQGSIGGVILILFSLSVYVGLYESYHTSDTPPKMMIYCGISEDVKLTAHRIYDYADKTGQGKELQIVVYGGGVYDNGFRWYLRDYRNVIHSLDKESGPPEGAVLIVSEGEKPVGNESWIANYDSGEQIHLLIWYPERPVYKGTLNQSWYFEYFLQRDSFKPYWTSNAWVYFPMGAD